MGFLVDQVIPQFPTLAEQLVSEIAAVVGASAAVRFSLDQVRAHDFDVDRAGAMYDDLVAGTADVILEY